MDGTTVYDRHWAALFVILGMEIMDLLDALVTTVAAPTIRADLGGGTSLIQWLWGWRMTDGHWATVYDALR